MQKKKYSFIFSLIYLLCTVMPANCDEWVILEPASKISTANESLQEGATVDFVVKQDVLVNNKILINKGTPVTGIVTYISPNSWGGEPAKITIEQLETFDFAEKPVAIKGSIYKSGNSHYAAVLCDLFYWTIRGGEVVFKPNKDEFVLKVKMGSL